MKKITFVIMIISLIINLSLCQVYANEQYIRVGLSSYNKVSSITLNNQSVYIGEGSNNTFVSDTKLTTNSTFTIKTVNTYSIKHNNTFSSFNDALNYSSAYEDSYVYKDNGFYVITKIFSTNEEANSYMISQNISGQVVKLDNCIAVYDDNNKIIAVYKNKMAIKTDEHISLGSKKYRNFIEITNSNNVLSVVNVLNLEEYLYGVVPSEMPSSWNKEALKAQAVACRNYAHSNLGLHSSEGYDVCDTVHCQVYNGMSGEASSTTEAVNETKGIFAYYNNEKINAVYFSSSGGYTDNSENVWNTSLPYLVAVKDEFEEGYKQWTRTFTFDELSKIVGLGKVNEILIENSTVTGRVTKLTLKCENGDKVLEKENIRTFFSSTTGGSLDSRNFKMLEGNTYIAPNTTNTTNTTNINSNSIYVVSSSGNTTITADKSYAINNSNSINTLNSTYVIDKTLNVIDLSNKTSSNSSSNVNYVSQISSSNTSSVTFVGKGWGHGVGMSQYGANSLAKRGYTYDQILIYYCTGIEVK